MKTKKKQMLKSWKTDLIFYSWKKTPILYYLIHRFHQLFPDYFFNWLPLFKLIYLVLTPGRTDVVFWNTCIYFDLPTSVSTYIYKLCHPWNFLAERRYLTSSRCLLYIVKSVRHHSYRMNYEGNVMRVLFLSVFSLIPDTWFLIAARWI